MSVGLTLRNDKVTVIFIDDGAYSAAPAVPEFIGAPTLKKEFEALPMMKCEMLADKQSLEERGIKNLVPKVAPAGRDKIARTITGSDIVIPF